MGVGVAEGASAAALAGHTGTEGNGVADSVDVALAWHIDTAGDTVADGLLVAVVLPSK